MRKATSMPGSSPTMPEPPNALDRGLSPVVRVAPAKVNLSLAVTGRTADGFHTLHTVMIPLGLADRLSVARAHGRTDSLAVTGLDAGPQDDTLLQVGPQFLDGVGRRPIEIRRRPGVRHHRLPQEGPVQRRCLDWRERRAQARLDQAWPWSLAKQSHRGSRGLAGSAGR